LISYLNFLLEYYIMIIDFNSDSEYNFIIYNDLIYKYIQSILLDIFMNEFYLIND